MKRAIRTPAGEVLTGLMLDLFRFNSAVLTAGDRLVAPLGLTSARWQILGAIAAAERAQPVAWLARDLGANRQNVQRIVNDLREDGLIVFEPNPHHRRAHYVVMTEKGRRAFDAAMEVQAPWINALSNGLSLKELETVRRVITALKSKLAASGAGDEED